MLVIDLPEGYRVMTPSEWEDLATHLREDRGLTECTVEGYGVIRDGRWLDFMERDELLARAIRLETIQRNLDARVYEHLVCVNLGRAVDYHLDRLLALSQRQVEVEFDLEGALDDLDRLAEDEGVVFAS